MNNKITISGDLGSGKSAVSKILIENLGCQYVSTGSIQRSIAEKMNMTSLELNRYSETHPEIDDEIDSVFKSLNSDPEAYIVDSRMAWHFIPDSFKLYLSVHPLTAGERVFNDSSRKNEGKYADKYEAKDSLLARRASEVRRFQDIYAVDISDLDHFDLMVDTTLATPEQIATLILDQYKKWQAGKLNHKFWFSPGSLLPTRPVHGLGVGNNKFKPNLEAWKPVPIVRIDGFPVMVDGHERVSAALWNDAPFVPCILKTAETPSQFGVKPGELLERWVDSSNLMDWEDFHGIEFPHSPEQVEA